MNHLTSQQFLEYTDGLFGHEIELHLRSCPECRQTLNGYKKVERTLHNIPMEKPAPDFTTAVMRQIGLNEASPFAWSLLKNIAPVLALALVVGITVTALKLTGMFEGSEIAGPGSATQSVYNDIGHGVKGGMTALNNWVSTYMSFAFAKTSYGLTAFIVVFFIFIALLDKYLIMPMMRKRAL